MVATFPGVIHGPLFYRALEKDKSTAVKENKGNFDRPMTLSASAKNELSWWVNNILSAFNRISHSSPSLIITSDASHVGWGPLVTTLQPGGTWSAKETQSHIKLSRTKVLPTLADAGINVTTFTTHSTRAALTSYSVHKAGISLANEHKAAGWSNASTFAKFYNKLPARDDNYGNVILESFSRLKSLMHI